MRDGPRIAPAGAIWVCGACGKTSRDRYGDENSSWDESCMMNSVLCHEHKKFNKNGLLCWHTFDEAPPVSPDRSQANANSDGEVKP